MQSVQVGTVSRVPSDQLTDRELHTLRLMSRGATNAEIARHLGVSLSTVRNGSMALYRKLGVSGRPEAVARALTLRLITATDTT